MHPHRSNALRYASAASAAHSRVYGGCAAEAAVSEASGPRVSGCNAQARGCPRSDELVSVASDSKFGTDPSVWTDHVANRHLDGGLVEALLQ